ncbi:MAG: response regulator [Chlamydiae bacterium]|nr:response regulator [Chlamydiota bacterium]MBI3276857.1 response regulator [Chlamydiota bacterium]
MAEVLKEKPTILLVDDDPGMRETLEDVLVDEGYQVNPIASGKEAVKEIRKGSFDIVIVDLKLPDVGGMKILGEAKEVNPESAVIMMTGYASVESAVEALNQGAFSYIIKPFNMDEVKIVIKKAFHQIRLFKENQRLIDELQLSNRKLEKVLADLNKASQLKSQFLASMSHELRTPINAIIGFADLILEDDRLDQSCRRDMSRIVVNANNLLSLVNDILDLSKIEAGKMTVHISSFDLGPLVEGCVLSIESMLKGKQVTLKTDVSKDILELSTDMDRLRQIIINLLSNAAKFTEKGEITASARMDQDDRVNISVTDTGIGIKEEDMIYIFDEFRQIDRGKKQKFGGTGLGLAISKRLAHLLGGNILVKSVLNKGSVFTLMIPTKIK